MCWLAFEAVFLFIYVVETKNKTLEETAALFDGDEATDTLAAATHGLAAPDPDSVEKVSSSHEEIAVLHK